MSRRSALLLLLPVLALLSSGPASAQFDSGAVLGSVHDPGRAPVPGARVSLRNLETGITSEVTTDPNGDYQFFTVKVGHYEVIARSQGFDPAVAKDVSVQVNARQRVDFLLTVATVKTNVEVSASTSLVETDTSEGGQVINEKQVVDLPLDGRNYSDLALLSAGVRRSGLADGAQPREGAFNVNGLRVSVNNFMLDGVDNNSYSTSNQGFSNQIVQPSPDSIVQFKVQTNNMSAEFGRSAGATINVAFKSGTNGIHGSAWEFLRNTNLNAVGFFKPTENVKPTLNRNQFGFTVGGPIRRNETFYFADYEGFRLVQSDLQFATLPTMAQRQGQTGTAIVNPFTKATYTSGDIPASAITPFAAKVLSDLVATNRPGTSNNFSRLVPVRDFSDKGDIKIDQNWNASQNSFIRISQRKDNRNEPGLIPGASGGNGNGRINTLNQALAAAHTWILRPTSVLEFRFGMTRTLGGKEPPMGGGPDLLATYGIPGYSSDPRVRGGLNTQSISGYTSLGRQATNPQWQNPSVWNPRVVFSQSLGRHTLKTGYEMQIIHIEDQDANPLYGTDTYAGVFSRPSGKTGTAIYNLADFMFGARSSIAVANLLVAQLRQRMQFGYLQDDWKVSNRFTLNLGVRYEYATPVWEANNHLSNYSVGGNSLVLAKDGSIYDRSLVRPDRNDFAPRIGLAYTLTPKTVIRTGYGISYNHFTRGGAANLLAFAGPQLVNVRISQTPGDPGFLKTQDGLPAGITDPQNFNPQTADVKWLPQDTRTSYTQNWVFSIQRELFHNMLLEVGYVGNHTVKQILYYDLNQARPNAIGENTPLQARRPDQAFSAIRVSGPDGWARYNGLQAKLEYRAGSDVYLLNSFSWSKALDNASDALDTGNGDNVFPQDGHNFSNNKGISSFNQPITNVTSLVYQVPFGKSRRWGSSAPRFLEAIAGGWRLGLINNAWSGQPVNLTWTVSSLYQVSSQVTSRVNVLGPVMLPSEKRGPEQSFLVSNVVLPTDPSHPFGNAGRNIAWGFPFWSVNSSLQKDFRLPVEGMRLQFRGEAFNLLNRSNFQAPDGNRSNAGFGTVRSTYSPRNLQFALKLYW